MKKIIFICLIVMLFSTISCATIGKPNPIYYGTIEMQDGSIFFIRNATIFHTVTHCYLIESDDSALMIPIAKIKKFDIQRVFIRL